MRGVVDVSSEQILAGFFPLIKHIENLRNRTHVHQYTSLYQQRTDTMRARSRPRKENNVSPLKASILHLFTTITSSSSSACYANRSNIDDDDDDDEVVNEKKR